MKLLISVANATEASAALAGGADIIDAKDPLTGALGPVSLPVLRTIHARVAPARPVTAALGDATDEATLEAAAYAFTAAGAALVKVGFAGITHPGRVTALTASAVRGVCAAGHLGCGVVAVAYADAGRAGSIPPPALVGAAARAGATGILLDTSDKSGAGLRHLIEPAALAAWVDEAHAARLFVALAGKLTACDLSYAQDAGADIVGMRGAACEGGRAGRVTTDRVRALHACCVYTSFNPDRAPARPAPPRAARADRPGRWWA
jgi:uncharacterized protein (UPF0264 family)